MSIEKLKQRVDALQVELKTANDRYGASLSRIEQARNELAELKIRLKQSPPDHYALQSKKRDLENEVRVLDSINIPKTLQERNDLMKALHLAKREYNVERFAPVVSELRASIGAYNTLQAKTAEVLTKLHSTYYRLPAAYRSTDTGNNQLHLPRLNSLPGRLLSCPMDENTEPEILFDFKNFACQLLGVDDTQFNIGDLLLFEPKQ